jgi:hypothetical protein
LELSEGTVPVTQVPCRGTYSPDSLLPAAPWRAPSAAEEELLWAERFPENPLDAIGILKVPEKLLFPLRVLGIDRVGSSREFGALVNSAAGKRATYPIVDYLASFRRRDEGFRFLGIGLNAPDLHTVTVDRSSGLQIGMHIDSWDKIEVGEREAATNRICLNLGREDRFFLFMNLPIREIARDRDPKLPAKEVVRQFIVDNPTYPVIRLRLAPGEAYLAPTENVIHDGSSLGKAYPDIQLTVRGYFGG